MPDGDILRLGLKGMNGPFLGAYEQICQGVSPEESTYKLAEGLQKQIYDYGSGPRDLLKAMLPAITKLDEQSDSIQPKQLAELHLKLEHERQKVGGQREGLDIVKDVCTKIMYDIQKGRAIGNVEHKLARMFLDQVLECNFDERIKTLRKQLDDIPLDVIQARRQESQPYLENHLDSFARQLLRDDSSKKMYRPSISGAKQKIGINDIIE